MSKFLKGIIGAAGALVVAIASISPKEAGSNIAAWAKVFGLETPQWLAVPSADTWGIWIGSILVCVAIVWFTWPIVRSHRSATEGTKLTYLRARDYELGPAIIQMAFKSAWGKWYAARDLLTTGVPIDVPKFLGITASNVKPKILDGDLAVRGRPSGQPSYEPIPRTDWRNAAIHFVRDPMTIWKMQVIPPGVVVIDRDGTVRHDGNLESIAHLSRYDSLLVDSHQFERLWPKTEKVADKQRRKFIKEARRKKLDSDTIKSLSD